MHHVPPVRGCVQPGSGGGLHRHIGPGFATHIGPSFDSPLSETACIHCGQCIIACPTGALYEKDNTGLVWNALGDPQKHVVVQTAPSVRAGLGEMFSLPIGTNVEGKLAAALRRLGFDGVFDTDFAADLTIMEEATEFLRRVQSGGTLPLITSCCPGWVKYCETFHPDFIPNLSTCKSPQQMFGAMAKSYYAEKMGLRPEDIFVVSVMPLHSEKVRDHPGGGVRRRRGHPGRGCCPDHPGAGTDDPAGRTAVRGAAGGGVRPDSGHRNRSRGISSAPPAA